MATEELVPRLFEAHRGWKDLRARQKELVEEIVEIQNQLAVEGIHITLDEFNDVSDNVLGQTVAAVIPPLPQPVEPVDEEGEVDLDEEIDVPVDTRSADQIRQDALAGTTEERVREQAEFATQLSGSFDRALRLGFGTASVLDPYTPTSDGGVKTRGMGG